MPAPRKEIAMSTVPNHALRQLRAGKLAIGLGVAQARTVGIAQIAKTAGFDWLFIDGEHSSLDADTAAQIATASLAVGVTPVVRVAGMEHWHASRMLDNGAQADEIAAVKGVDAILIGTNDRCFEMGIPGQFNDPRATEAYKKVIAACR